MNIGFYGAGKVGCSLGKFFTLGGISVSGYYSRNQESAKEAATFTKTKQYDTLKALVADSDAIFLTVSDSAIASAYEQIRAFDLVDKIICHCSGSMSAKEVFPDADTYGATIISIHPLFPFSNKLTAYQEVGDAFFCLEGDEGAVEVFAPLLKGLGVQVQVIDPDKKALYHAGGAFVCNLVCPLIKQGIEILTACGFEEEGARVALTPLMRSNLEHIIDMGPVEALTGPFDRADSGTVEKHLTVLEGAAKDIYTVIGKELARMGEEKHPERDYSAIARMLEDVN